MPGIIPAFVLTTVPPVEVIPFVLPDTELLEEQVIIRPHTARFAGTPVSLLRINLAAAIQVVSPAIASLRKINLDPALVPNQVLLADGIDTLLEISPLPFFMEGLLRHLPGGVPVFYIGMPTSALVPIEDDDAFDQGAVLGTAKLIYITLVLQDRVAMEPWGWMKIMANAITAIGEDPAAWNNLFNSLYPAAPVCLFKILDHTGQPHAATRFTVTVNGQAQTVSSAANGLLDISFCAGQAFTLRWLGAPNANELLSLPVMAVYETGSSAAPAGLLSFDNSFSRAHLQVFELANWFSAPNNGSALQRFFTNSHLQPLFDGYETFRLIAADMINCVPPDGVTVEAAGFPGAHFAGWGFKEFVPDPALLDENGKPYTYAGLVQHLTNKQVEVRALVNKLFSVPGDMDDEAQKNALLMAFLLTDIVLIASFTGIVESDETGKIIVMAAQILSLLSVVLIKEVNKKLEDAMDQSDFMFPKFNEILPGMAIRSAHPAANADNPLFESITVPTPSPITITDFITGTGTWHQKIQLFKRAIGKFDAAGNQFAGYVGGMDMNGNRLDNFGRQGKGAYHDVHCRVTGPAVSDIFKTWDERFRYEISLPTNPDVIKEAYDPPAAAALPLKDEKHIIQIGRTLFKPHPPDSAHALPFARQGDNTINQNLIRAIRGAREYIYIEDQYFVPNDTTINAAYFDALMEAADHCKRLVIISPGIMTLADIPFAHERRANLTRRLQNKWGRRALIGAPMRRPLLPGPGGITHEGRCILYGDITAADSFIKIGPKARLPKALPFWLWINGELMLALELTDEDEMIAGHPVIKLKVIRGSQGVNPRWGASTRSHTDGSAVTASQLRGIFVHAKNMMIDDTHVYIGSANINRRGLFYDGEIGAFAVPEQLKAAPDNPAKQLRTGLWAEQLGLPPSMGAALLQDPIAAFELFRRHFMAGNRFVPLTLFDFNDDPDLKFSINSNLLVNALSNLGMGWLVTQRSKLYNTITDPTTFDDPQPTPGP
jgi:phosphatidylserine/phosphatidylglycerophosphate/cardiolipin synthase-like enzyme